MTGAYSGTVEWIKANFRHIRGLPEPGVNFYAEELPEKTKEELLCLSSHDIINRVDMANNGENNGKTVYQSNPVYYDFIQDVIEQREKSDGILPCGHNGFVNVGHGLKCKDCNIVHDKEDVTA